MSLSNQKWEIQPTIINFHPNEKIMNYTTTHLQFNLEVLILLITYLIEYVLQIKQKI